VLPYRYAHWHDGTLGIQGARLEHLFSGARFRVPSEVLNWCGQNLEERVQRGLQSHGFPAFNMSLTVSSPHVTLPRVVLAANAGAMTSDLYRVTCTCEPKGVHPRRVANVAWISLCREHADPRSVIG
jgi:hypothetical protein